MVFKEDISIFRKSEEGVRVSKSFQPRDEQGK